MRRRFGHAVQKLVGAEIRPGEGHLVFVFFINLLLLLTAYYILKVVREPLILSHGGAVSRSYARGVQAVLLIAMVPAYGLLANRVEPARLVNWVNGFFVVSLGFFLVLGASGVPLGFAFFVWLGIFSTMAIAQFWSLANDLLSEAEGKRLFPMIAAGGTLGGIVGSQIAARSLGSFGPYELMCFAAGLLLVCMTLTHFGRTSARDLRQRHPRASVESQRDARGGFTLLLRDRYLLLIGLSVLLLNLINTTGDFVLAEMVNTRAANVAAGAADADQARRQYIGAFYGDFQTAVSVLTAVIQILFVARLFKAAGLERAMMFLPLFVVTGYGASALLPLLAMMVIVKITENSADYSLQNTVQQALFLPTSRDAKYKAKTAIDTFLVRVGDLASTSLVFVGMQMQLGARGFAWVNVGLGVLWVGVVLAIGRRYRELSADSQRREGVRRVPPPAQPPGRPAQDVAEAEPETGAVSAG
jgi:ATP:ADP antiporter, AAA family